MSEPPGPEIVKGQKPVDKGCAYTYFLEGKAAEMDGDLDKAISKFEQALACDDDADYIRNHLAMLLSRVGRTQQALHLVEEIVARNPADSDSKILLGNLYAYAGEIKNAVKIYLSVLKEQPDNQHVMMMLGTVYARSGELGKAMKVFEELVAKDPQSYVGYYYLARIYKGLDYFDKAAAAYEKALSLNWSIVLSFELADFYEQQKQLPKAIDLYKKVLAEDETNEQAHRQLAAIYLQLDKVDMAIKQLQKLRRYVDDKRKIDLTIGRVMLQRKRFKRAADFFEARLKKDPDFDAVRYLLAVTYHELGNDKKTKQLLGKMSPSSKRYEDAVLFLATIFRDDKKYLALENLLKNNIADEKSRKVSFYVALAALYEEQEKIPKAKAIYDEAFKVYPADAKLFFNYGLFLDGIGDLAGAMTTMEKVLSINPDDPYALNYVGYTWADKGENLEQALEYVKKAIVSRPDDGFIRDSLGWIYFKLGKFDEAVVELEKAVKQNSADPTIHEHLGDAYMKIGKRKKSIMEYREALKLQKDDKKKERIKRKLEKTGK